MNQALIDSIQARLDAAYAGDEVKPVCTPFSALGAEMVQRLPDVSGDILVLSDLGLLFAVLRRLHLERRDFSKVRFIGHTEAQMKMNQELGVQGSIVCYNQLTDWFKKDVGMKFDVIIGNPPYQDSSEKNHSNSLWVKFAGQSKAALASGGTLALVMPATWAGGEFDKENKGRQLTVSTVRSRVFDGGSFVWLGLGDPINKNFNVGIEFSAFVWVDGQRSKTTLLTSEGEMIVDSDELKWIPMKCSPVVLSIMKKTVWSEDEKLEVLMHNSANSDLRNKNISIGSGDFELFNTSAQWKSGKKVFSSVDCKHRLTKKVVFSDSGYAAPRFDNGKLGLAHHGRAFEVDSETEGINLVSYLESKFVRFLTQTKASSGATTDFILVARSLPKVDLSRTWSDEQLYDHFKLTQAERDLIKQTLK